MSVTTRERLLDASLRSFASVGVEGTVITDLEKAAGLAPGSGGFYRYFRTKEEVLDAVVRREIDRVRAARSDHSGHSGPDGSGDTRAALAAELTASLGTLKTIGPLIAILAREHGRIPELAAEIAAELVDPDVRDVSGDRARRGGPVNAVVLSALVGYRLSTDYFGAPPGGVDEGAFVEALLDLITRHDSRPSGSRGATLEPRGCGQLPEDTGGT